MGLFGAAHRWGVGRGAKRPPHSEICHTYSRMMKRGRVIPYLKKIQIYRYRNRYGNTDIDCIWYISNSFNCLKVFKDCFNKDGYNFDDVSKISYPGPC